MQPRLELRLSQKLVMTPQLQQAIKLLQLSRLELQEALTQQLEENPMLEEAGYLRVSLASLINTDNMTPARAAQVLKVVQGFDPSGVAARDLKECLAIQIEQLGLSGSLVEAMVVNHLPDLERKRYPAIAK